TPRQARFVEEFCADCNATQAAIRAGYAARYANREASRLLSKVDIQEAIAAAQKARSERLEIDQDAIAKGLHDEAKRHGPGSSHSARVAAWLGLAKLLGLMPDGKDDTRRGRPHRLNPFGQLSDEEIDRAIAKEEAMLAALRAHYGRREPNCK